MPPNPPNNHELSQKERALSVFRAGSRALLHSSIEAELLESICRVCVENGGYKMAWVGLAEQDAGHTVRPVAQMGFTEGYLDGVHISWGDNEFGKGPTGTAIRSGKACFARANTGSPDYVPWSADAIQRGYAASIALPLHSDGLILGALNIYAAEVDAFTPAEVSLLSELADNLAYGIAALRLRQKHAAVEAALETSQKYLANLLEMIPDGIITLDSTGQILSVNRAAEIILGLSRDKITSRAYNALDWKITSSSGIPLADDELPFRRVMRLGDVVFDIELGVEQPGGQRIILSVNAAPLYDEIGSVIGVTTALRDVTAQKRDQEALLRSERRFSQLFNASPVAQAISNQKNGFITDVNESCLLLLGFRREEVIGKTSHDFNLFAMLNQSQELTTLFAQHGFVDNYELKLRTKSGKTLDVLASLEPIDLGTNEPLILGSIVDITERKQAEQKLSENEKILHAMINASMESVLLLELDGRVRVANRTVAQRMNITVEELIGKNVYDLLPPPVARLRRQYAQQAIETRMALSFEDERNGATLVNAISPVLDDQGNVTHLAVIAFDISEQKRAETALQESQANLQGLLDAITETVGLFELNGKVIIANRTLAERFNTTVDQITGKIIGNYFPEDVTRHRLQFIHQVVETGQPVRFEDERNGRLMLNSIAPVFDSTGQVRRLASFNYDITELKQAEQQLRLSEERFSKAFHANPAAISINALNSNRFIDFNDSFLDITGYTRDQLIDRTPEQAGISVTGHQGQDMLRQLVNHEVVSNIELVLRTHQGVHRNVLASFELIELDGEDCILTFIYDITDRKLSEKWLAESEERYRRLNQSLEQRVARRTAQLENANHDLESFSYSVSHDLRAPLRAISGFADILSERHRSGLNTEGQHYIDNIVQASEHMGQLIDDLLLYSRVGRRTIRSAPVHLDQLFQSLGSYFGSRLEACGGTLNIPGDLPVIHGDDTLLSQIFSNLLDNAITYRRSETPLQISITWRIENNETVLAVHDNGIGIPTEYHEKIFKVFQRLHRENEYPGTGIGLATVRKAVDLLGGRVWVESATGEGSVFYVALPETPPGDRIDPGKHHE